jgi:hypothetical protein
MCLFVFLCGCVCSLDRVGASCVGRPTCVCAVWAPLRRVNIDQNCVFSTRNLAIAPQFRPGAARAAMAIRALAHATRSRAAFTRGFKIYTRTGDAGSSSLFNGERRSKDHEVFEALGDSDELNAAIGLARAHCETQSASGTSLHDIMAQLDAVQSRLLDVGSAVATPRSSSNEKQLARVRFCDDGASVSSLEQWMDALDQVLLLATSDQRPATSD